MRLVLLEFSVISQIEDNDETVTLYRVTGRVDLEGSRKSAAQSNVRGFKFGTPDP